MAGEVGCFSLGEGGIVMIFQYSLEHSLLFVKNALWDLNTGSCLWETLYFSFTLTWGGVGEQLQLGIFPEHLLGKPQVWWWKRWFSAVCVLGHDSLVKEPWSPGPEMTLTVTRSFSPRPWHMSLSSFQYPFSASLFHGSRCCRRLPLVPRTACW